ncbi:hypothetical protein P153DRAFT_394779 [Dothidotthia symphoricarpi CBS 119687]|uniref:F-box domain-containing protein n=1 Tax=Dothidotthia symphoricarpi CBS 119687 TaxID=1392245 RepID=A0A6A6AJN8_9PLEO|nr:uncharacterized protein P153DRAFT_394779 [Dothidotthia symphoricarpi CBS 119687]KAF2131443.1 hypothetical protein P153DRAFT_394779 [Dothidotthia symphoricarpi CBS 119687]
MDSHVQLPPFLCLPTELRYDIYDHLSCDEPISYLFPHPSPITSIDCRGPPIQLLVTCRAIYEEIRLYYFGRATFRLFAYGSKGTRREDMAPSTFTVIRLAKKIELMMVWNITSRRAQTSIKTWPWSMNGWLEEQVDLLLDEGRNLQEVLVSVRDVSEGVKWETKVGLLWPLEKLKGRVRFTVGEITAADDEEQALNCDLARFVRELNSGYTAG